MTLLEQRGCERGWCGIVEDVRDVCDVFDVMRLASYPAVQECAVKVLALLFTNR
jgi:hypothetical protein